MTAVWGGINFVTGHNTFQGNHNFSLSGFDQNNTSTDGTLLSFLEFQTAVDERIEWLTERNINCMSGLLFLVSSLCPKHVLLLNCSFIMIGIVFEVAYTLTLRICFHGITQYSGEKIQANRTFPRSFHHNFIQIWFKY